MRTVIVVVVVILAGMIWLMSGGMRNAHAQDTKTEPNTIYDFKVTTINGNEISLEQYHGHPLMIVNTASRCGFTGQYSSLQELYDRYKDRGFMILAFPSNDFMGQEPGTNAEIKKFCTLKYNVTFDLFEKITVKGKDQHPLYYYLTNCPGFEGAITWNFNKFLINKEGQVVARFKTRTNPLDEDVVKEVENIM